MGNLEKPLTWGLVIVLLGYLFITNCDCGEESSCRANNDFNIESEVESDDVKQEIQAEDENLNVDSMLGEVLERFDYPDGTYDSIRYVVDGKIDKRRNKN
jgi:hypothetical protein